MRSKRQVNQKMKNYIQNYNKNFVDLLSYSNTLKKY